MSNFKSLVNELHARSEADILAGFDTTFSFTGYEGKRYHVASWLVADILEDDIAFMSQEFFEEVFDMYDAVMQDEDYFGGEFPFVWTGEVLA